MGLLTRVKAALKDTELNRAKRELEHLRLMNQDGDLYRLWVQQIAREKGYDELIDPRPELEYLSELPDLGGSLVRAVLSFSPKCARPDPQVEHINHIEVTDRRGFTQTWQLRDIEMSLELTELDRANAKSKYRWARVRVGSIF